MSNTPATYLGEQHDLIFFNRNCKLCNLTTGKSVGGAGPDDLKEIKLIVISDHPGHYEEDIGYPFASKPHEGQGKRLVEDFPTAGEILRRYLFHNFNLDTYKEVWMTNAVKCNPRGKTIQDSHVKKCVRNHLLEELTEIDRENPSVPILIAGNKAFEALGYLDKTLTKKKLGKSLKSMRRSNHYKLWSHPLVFTFNPASVRDAKFQIESDFGYEDRKKNGFPVKAIKILQSFPELPGSPRWMLKKDLSYLEPLIRSF
jgi:uracil-DNA glycosylase